MCFLPIVLVALLTTAEALDHQPQNKGPYNETECENCVLVNTTCFQITYLMELQAPFRSQVVIPKMEVLHSKNTLYYSFEPEFEDPEYSKIAFVSLDNPEIQNVINNYAPEKVNFTTLSIEQDKTTNSRDIVYLGGDDGIYELSPKTNNAIYKNLVGDKVTSIFYYKPYLYFVEASDTNIIKRREVLDKDRTSFVSFGDYEDVKNFVILRFGNEDVKVFISKQGLFVAKGKDLPVQISNNPFMRGITIDNNNEVHTWWIDDIYKVVLNKFDFSKSKLVKVASIDGLGAMAFDKDNKIIFNTGKSLYRLTDTNKTC